MTAHGSSNAVPAAVPTADGRLIGRVRGVSPGPTILVIAGLHGNEPAGVTAARELIRSLAGRESDLCGEVVALAGNLTALLRGVRFVDRDLNRQWTETTVAGLAEGGPGPVERSEQRELLAAIREVARDAVGPLHTIDLHTSSADGPPFLTVGDTLRNRSWAQELPVPMLLGIEEQIDGALLEYLGNRGVITLGVEAGRHDRGSSVDRHRAILWLALVSAGALREEDIPELAAHRRTLIDAGRGIPDVVEVRRRHAIRPEDEFKMLSGFSNFDRIERGQALAADRAGQVLAGERGLLLLPLYQGLGDDGFFVGREVRPVWLAVSRVLRRLRIAAMLPFLPGVRRLPGRPGTLIVDRRIARFWPLEIFHLLGFRKRREQGNQFEVSRRQWDLDGPARVEI